MRRTIVALGDIHGASGGVARIVQNLSSQPPDLVALVGDLGSDLLWRRDGEPEEKVGRWQASIDRIFAALEPLGTKVVLVPGNHDARRLSVRGGSLDVDGKLLQVDGLSIAGVGGAGPKLFGLPYEWTEEELSEEMGRRGWRRGTIDLLLCHAPPRETGLDTLLNGLPAGSEVVHRLIGEVQPPLFLCGHIHESVGHRMLGTTLAVNAGRLIHGSFDQFGRPKKGAPTAYQFYRVELEDRSPVRLERIRLSCTGPVHVRERAAWDATDGFRRSLG